MVGIAHGRHWTPSPALYQLRTALAAAGVDIDTALVADSETIGLHADAIRGLDVARFDACLDDLTCSAEAAVAL